MDITSVGSMAQLLFCYLFVDKQVEFGKCLLQKTSVCQRMLAYFIIDYY